ncbi:MAG: hypothetical protein AMJ67_08515 [Betaproteobacteria bacterium SG8_41]|nr:MAG: hypothetical protein AMJ67_08515 [Betaproteobacteria bacterium SG8_41]
MTAIQTIWMAAIGIGGVMAVRVGRYRLGPRRQHGRVAAPHNTTRTLRGIIRQLQRAARPSHRCRPARRSAPAWTPNRPERWLPAPAPAREHGSKPSPRSFE